MASLLVNNNPKSVSPSQYRELLRTYIEERCMKQLEELLLLESSQEDHVAFKVHSHDLVDYDSGLAFAILNYPKLLLPIFDEAVFEAQTILCKHPYIEGKYNKRVLVKPHCHVRIIDLPGIKSFVKQTISDISSHEADGLIQISGTIVRTGTVRMLEVSKEYECENRRCMKRFTLVADPEQDYMLPQPRICPSAVLGGGSKCTSTQLRDIEGSKVCVDYQEIKIQDRIEKLSFGSIPRSVVVILEADLVDRYNAGDDVIIIGTLLRQWRPVVKGSRCIVEIAIRANSIQSINSNENLKSLTYDDSYELFDHFWKFQKNVSKDGFSGRDIIVKSICPQLYGLFMVKLAVLLTLVGGSTTRLEGGVRRRSQSHLLLVGDPGCGKSQILRFAASTCARSVLTTGIGTTGAGLTCTAVKDGADWSIEAGALVLANDGLCCIDEFSSIKDYDLATVHEAMEQQTLSVAKAGLVIKLNTRSSVLACCNPKGSYDITADLTANTAIASPLLSRFDLILILLDSPQKDWDKKVSTYLLQESLKESNGADSDVDNDEDKTKFNRDELYTVGSIKEEKIWNLQTLRQYISLLKSRFQPVMSSAARCLLLKYYSSQRQSEDRSSARTTVRLLESLVRLSEGHAKIMFRNTVEFCDAIIAIKCISLSQSNTSLMEINEVLHSDFPVDSYAWYVEQENSVLVDLQCTKDSIFAEARNADRNSAAMDAMSNSNDKSDDEEIENALSSLQRFNSNIVAINDNGESVDLSGSSSHMDDSRKKARYDSMQDSKEASFMVEVAPSRINCDQDSTTSFIDLSDSDGSDEDFDNDELVLNHQEILSRSHSNYYDSGQTSLDRNTSNCTGTVKVQNLSIDSDCINDYASLINLEADNLGTSNMKVETDTTSNKWNFYDGTEDDNEW